MARLTFRDFSKYLCLSPPEDMCPVNSLRRARGVHPVQTQSIRSRRGSTKLNSYAAKSLFVFDGDLYTFNGTTLYGGLTNLTVSGTGLSFLSCPPVSNKTDWLFVSNGDALYKMNPTTGVYSQWGIAAPADGFTATLSLATTKTISMCEAASDWTVFQAAVVDDAVYKVQGTQSIMMTVVAGTKGYIYQNVTLDLSMLNATDESSDSDYISLHAYIDEPANLEYIQIQFSLNNTSFSPDTLSYTFNFNPSNSIASGSSGFSSLSGLTGIFGMGSYDDYSTTSQETANQVITDKQQNIYMKSKAYKTALRKALEHSKIADYDLDDWQHLFASLSSFTRTGSGAYDWSDVKAVRIKVKTNSLGEVNIRFDQIELLGGCGMQGDYTYRITYFNEDSGSESNANPTEVVVDNNLKGAISLANLPAPSDAQVTHVNIYRTIGDGSVPFYCARVADGVTTFTDTVADCYIMDPRSDAELLSSTALEYSNIVPDSNFGYCAVFNSTVFWTMRTTATSGNLYYSRVGYAEANEGFIRVTTSGDPLQNLIKWNGFLYVFSKAHLYQVYGTNPFYSREVFGVPGTSAPDTVTPTPYGIMYQALDGVRLFNGTRSERMGWTQLGRLLAGEDVENLTSFVGTCAAWFEDEYYISDGSQTLAYHVTNDTWRDIGVGYDCLFADKQAGKLYGGNSTGAYELNKLGTVLDEATAIPFDVQTSQIQLDMDKEIMVNHIYIDADTNGEALTVTLITDLGETTLGPMSSATRSTTVIPIGKSYNRIAVRLTGSLTDSVEIFGIGIDADISEEFIKAQQYKQFLTN